MSSGKFWIGMVFAFLAIDLTVAAVTVYFAHSDPSVGVVKDYHAKAMKWDEVAKQRVVNERLGWTARVFVTPPVRDVDDATVTIALLDSEGKPIEGGSITATALHVARSSDTTELRFRETTAGAYSATMRMRREGFWEFEITVDANGERFTTTERLFVRL